MKSQPTCPFKHNTSLCHRRKRNCCHDRLILKASSSPVSNSQPGDHLWVTSSERQHHLLWEAKSLWDWFKDENNIRNETSALTNANFRWTAVKVEDLTYSAEDLDHMSMLTPRAFPASRQGFQHFCSTFHFSLHCPWVERKWEWEVAGCTAQQGTAEHPEACVQQVCAAARGPPCQARRGSNIFLNNKL